MKHKKAFSDFTRGAFGEIFTKAFLEHYYNLMQDCELGEAAVTMNFADSEAFNDGDVFPEVTFRMFKKYHEEESDD